MLFKNIEWSDYYKFKVERVDVEHYESGKVKKKKYSVVKDNLTHQEATKLSAEIGKKEFEAIDHGKVVLCVIRDHGHEDKLKELSGAKSEDELKAMKKRIAALEDADKKSEKKAAVNAR